MIVPVKNVFNAIGLACLAVPGATLAAPQQSEGNGVLAAVTQCRSITEAATRLACFDKASAALETARTRNDIVMMDREEVREKRRTLFGLALPDVNLFGRNTDREPEIAQIESSVTGLSSLGRGRFIVNMADGSTWRTTEVARVPPEVGNRVVVKRAALNSFRGTFQGERPIRMERVR